MNTKTLILAYISDGYLYGAACAESGSAYSAGYWIGLHLEGQPFELVEAEVPTELAERLERYGTSEQDFSDGYAAASAVAEYATSAAFHSEGYATEDECPECSNWIDDNGSCGLCGYGQD